MAEILFAMIVVCGVAVWIVKGQLAAAESRAAIREAKLRADIIAAISDNRLLMESKIAHRLVK